MSNTFINNNNMCLLYNDNKFNKYYLKDEDNTIKSSSIKHILSTKQQLELYDIATNLRELKGDTEKFDPLYIHTCWKDNHAIMETVVQRFVDSKSSYGQPYYISKNPKLGDKTAKRVLKHIHTLKTRLKFEVNVIKLLILSSLYSTYTYYTKAELSAMSPDEKKHINQAEIQSMHKPNIDNFYKEHPELAQYKCFYLTAEHVAEFFGVSYSAAKSMLKVVIRKGLLHRVSYKKVTIDSEYMPVCTMTVYLMDVEKAIKYLYEEYGLHFKTDGNLDVSQYNSFIYSITQYDLLKIRHLIKTKSLSSKLMTRYEKVEAKLVAKEKQELGKILKEIVFAINASKNVLPIIDWANDFFGEDLVDIKYVQDGRTRFYNAVCGTRNDITDNAVSNRNSKRVFLLQQLLDTNSYLFDAFDVNGSIYRLSYAIGHYFNSYMYDNTEDYVLPYDKDIYFEIYKACKYPGTYSSDTIDETTFKEKIRPIFKTLCMPIYMHEGCATERAIQFNNNVAIEYKNNMSLLFNSNTAMRNHANTKILLDIMGIDCTTLYILLRKGLHEFLELHTFERSKVFVYESILHLYMLHEFNVNLGIRTINAYDCFYFDKNANMSDTLFNIVHERCLRKVIEELERDKILTPELYNMWYCAQYKQDRIDKKLKTICKPQRPIFNYKKDITDYHISICPKLEPLRFYYDKLCNDAEFVSNNVTNSFVELYVQPNERIEMSADAARRIKKIQQRKCCNKIIKMFNFKKFVRSLTLKKCSCIE